MGVISALKKGAVKSALSHKLLVFMWVILLSVVLLVAIPLKTNFNSIFGNSLISERLLGGFDAGLIGDMGPAFYRILSTATAGGFLVIVAGFLLLTFFSGGLFTRYTTEYGEFRISAFMKASSQHFLSFFVIGIIVQLLIAAWTFIIIGIPAGVKVAINEDASSAMGLSRIMTVIWALGIPVLLLVADYSRRWITSTGSRKALSAIKTGFSSLGCKFFRSYLSILIIFVINLLLLFLALWMMAAAVPEKGGMLFLFFLGTQALFLVRLYLRAWRYATVTELALHAGE